MSNLAASSEITNVELLWLRQAGESSRAYQAFTVYRDLGVEARSLRATASRLGKSGALIERWSARWRWQVRVASWDEEQDRRALRDHEEQLRRIAVDQLRIGELIRAIVLRRLETVTPEQVPLGVAVRLWEAGIREEREAIQTLRDLAEPTPAAAGSGPRGALRHDPLAIYMHANPTQIGPIITALAEMRDRERASDEA